MENINVKFIEDLGWQEYSMKSNAPANCYFKVPYPIALWWDSEHQGFWLIYLNELTRDATIIGKDFIKSKEEYDKIMIPILKVIQDEERDL